MAKIVGGTVATSMPLPDWKQTDPKKADYIKNKPDIITEEMVVSKILETGYNNFATIPVGEKTGEVVAISDALTLGSHIAISLSSDTITDFSGVAVKMYGKNLCPKRTAGVTTSNGITFTRNEDGTITANGTATADAICYIVQSGADVVLPVDTQIYISGCPQGGGSTKYYIELSWVGWFDYGKGFKGELSSPGLATNWGKEIRIVIKSGQTVENLVFKPQIEIGTAATEYEQYAEPISVNASEYGIVKDVTPIGANVTFISNTSGVNMRCTYKRDLAKVIERLEQLLNTQQANV